MSNLGKLTKTRDDASNEPLTDRELDAGALLAAVGGPGVGLWLVEQ